MSLQYYLCQLEHIRLGQVRIVDNSVKFSDTRLKKERKKETKKQRKEEEEKEEVEEEKGTDKNKKNLFKNVIRLHNGKISMPVSSKLHIPPTNYHLLAAQQEPHRKA